MALKPERPGIERIKDPELSGRLLGPRGYEDLLQVLRTARESGDAVAEALALERLGEHFDTIAPYDHERAVGYFSDALELFPYWPEAYFNRAVAEIHAGRFSEAISDFDKEEEWYADLDRVYDEEPSVMMGKILLFRAEARNFRRDPGDLDLARHEIMLANGFLPATRTGWYWKRHAPKRLRDTFVGIVGIPGTRGGGLLFILGVLVAAIVLFAWLRQITF